MTTMDVWIGRDGERLGPYKEEDIRQWLRSGQINPQDLAWYDGLADWQPLAVLFRDALPVAPPPTPSHAPQQVAAGVAPTGVYAGFWKRVAAYIVDSILLSIPAWLIEKALGADAAKASLEASIRNAGGNFETMMAAYQAYYIAVWPSVLVVTLVVWVYFAACESSAWQATIGKLALGIRVTGLSGQRIGFVHALGRYAGKFVSAFILCIGFLMVAWTERKQGLHDLLANTLVVNGRASTQPAPQDRDSFSA